MQLIFQDGSVYFSINRGLTFLRLRAIIKHKQNFTNKY